MEGDFAIWMAGFIEMSYQTKAQKRPAGAICSEFAKAAYAASSAGIVEGEFVVSLLQPAMA